MSTTIVTTKLNIPPPRVDWVSRPRLIDRLDQALKSKLTLVCAPAGFGKTTLVTSWLNGLGERLPANPRLAWLSLEEDDDTPLRFVAYLTAALQTLDDGIGQTAKSLLEAPQPPAANHLMTLVINDLADRPEPSVLVLDDFHVIDHPDVQTAVAFFLEHLPPRLHLIIATREEPKLPLARLRVQWQVVEIRLEDLRFTREETTAFLNQTMGLSLSAEMVEALEGRTEGWIAGLQMAALSLRGRERRPGVQHMPLAVGDFGGVHGDIIDYLGAEVLRQQPIEIRAFLRQTSILDRLSAPLCDAVTGQQNSREDVLSELEGDDTLFPDHPVRQAALAGPHPGLPGHRLRDRVATAFTEGVAEAVDGADETRLARVVPDDASDLRHQVRQVGLDNERLRPEAVVEIGLGKGFRPALQEGLQELIGLR